MSFKYGAYVNHFYYLKKGEVEMSNKIKAGDLIECDGAMYNDYRIGQKVKVHEDEHGLYVIGHADAKYRLHELSISKYADEAFAMCVGYSFVKRKPELPLRGSELTKKLLEKQKYVLCLVSHVSDDNARRFNPPKLHIVTGVESDYFNTLGGISADFAVPVDMNGNEITEIE